MGKWGGATHEEAPSCQDVEHANRVAPVVRPRSERGKHHQDDGRDQQRVGARPVVREPPKRQLANDRPGKGDIPDILLCVGVLVQVAVLQAKNGGDGADDLHRLDAASVSHTQKKNQAFDPPDCRTLADAGQVRQPSTADRTAQVGALTLLMYPSENRPAPQAMTGTMAFRKGWRGASTATASCWAEPSDSADFFLRKLSMMRQSAKRSRKPSRGWKRERLVLCEAAQG